MWLPGDGFSTSVLRLPVEKQSTFQTPACCAASGSAKFRLLFCSTGFSVLNLSPVSVSVLSLPSAVTQCHCHFHDQLGSTVLFLVLGSMHLNFWVSKSPWWSVSVNSSFHPSCWEAVFPRLESRGSQQRELETSSTLPSWGTLMIHFTLVIDAAGGQSQLKGEIGRQMWDSQWKKKFRC